MPISAHSIVSYLGPEQSRALPMMHALHWREEINMGILKSCPTFNQCICRFDSLHIHRCAGCNMTQLNMFLNHCYVLRQCMHKGDNLLHHSQSFRIMVKGWKWDPRIWYDLLSNWPSTHKMSCKYLHADQSYDGMHLLLHWTTLCVMHEIYARILSVQWRPF